MTTHEVGGPAFPSPNDVKVAEFRSGGHAGMTLHDYFAAAALTGILACTRDYVGGNDPAARVRLAWQYADAMIAEGKKP